MVATTLERASTDGVGKRRPDGVDERSPTLRDRLAVSPAGLLGLLVVLVGVLVGTGALSDNSFFTHLATGRLILAEGFPRHDPYTFTSGGEAWVVQSWFASLIYGGLDRAFGAGSIVVLHGILGGVAGGAAWALSRPAGALLGRVLLMIPVMAIGAGYWLERPYMFGLAALAVTLLATEGRIHPGWLVPVGWVWANTHGGWPLGLGAVVLLIIGRRLDGGDWATERRTLVRLAIGLVIGAVNPYGLRILSFPFDLLRRREQLLELQEWQPPTFQSTPQLALLALVALALVALARRPSWRAALPLLVFLPLALTGVRNLPVTALVLLPGIAAGLAGLGTEAGRVRRRPVGVMAAVVVALGVGVLVAAAHRSAFRLDHYPVAQIELLEARGLAPTEARLLTPDYVGNYLTLRYGTDVAIYVDDRVEVAAPALTDEYIDLLEGRPGWEAVLVARRFDAVIWRADEPLAEFLRLDPSWDIVDADDQWIVAVPAR